MVILALRRRGEMGKIQRRTDRILEGRISKSFCDSAREIGRGEPCLLRKYEGCWLVEKYGLICPEVKATVEKEDR